jgi:hypothetical protein
MYLIKCLEFLSRYINCFNKMEKNTTITTKNNSTCKFDYCSFYENDMKKFIVFNKPINLFNKKMNINEDNKLTYKLSFESLKKKQIIEIDDDISFMTIDDNSMMVKFKEKRIIFEFSNEKRNKNIFESTKKG